ncbi:MAG: hypothetical protein AAGB46_10795 [Verrucomicrobiota bacterium]
MPSQPIVFTGIILGQEKRSEKFNGYTVLSPEIGKRLVLKRISSKSNTINHIDFFDDGEFTAEDKNESGACFFKDFDLRSRRTKIAEDYEAFKLAMRFAKLIVRNPIHEENAKSLYQLAIRSLDAWQDTNFPEAAYLKSVYLYCRDEGYPINAEWYSQLASPDAATAKHVLNTSLSEIDADKHRIAHCIERLEHYLQQSTHIEVAW